MSRKPLLVTIIVVLVLILGGLGAWALSDRQSSEPDDSRDTSNAESSDQQDESSDTSEESTQDDGKDHESTFTPSLYYIAVEDNGVSGELIGCGDSLVRTEGVPAEGSDAVIVAFEALLDNSEREIGQSGLYNALYQSNLSISHWVKNGDTVTVDLSGTVKSGGACDDARIIQQLKKTATVASGANKAVVLIDGTTVEELLGTR